MAPRVLLALLALSALSAPEVSAQPAKTQPLVVQTVGGAVRGVVRNGVREFRGIPYANSNAGEKRWTAPVPAAAWTGVRDAENFGPACPQVARFNLTEASDNEDCLSVNISTPVKAAADGKKRAVLVWIHGGGFVGGASSLYRLDWLAKEVVVVSMNYRFGALGFMPHPAFDADFNGNLGLEDQREALRWVKRNIAAFGGDPDRVTLAGESAGGGSTCMHLATPERSGGLFQQAIIQSAGCLQPMPSVAEASDLGLKVAAHSALKCDDQKAALDCLRRAPLAALLQAQTEVAGTAIMGYGPSVGSKANPRPMRESLRTGNIVRVPLLMGGTRDELRLYIGYDVQAGRPVTRENYSAHLKGLYGERAEAVEMQYPLRHADVPPETLGTAMSDYNPAVGINNCLYLRTGEAFAKFAPVWQWEFADRNAPVIGVGIPAKPDVGFELGAVHSSELNYLFPKLSNTSKIDAPDLALASQKVSDQMVAYWTSFVKNGAPKVANAPAWPRYGKPGSVMRFEPGKTGPYDSARLHKCGFWNGLYPERLGAL